MVDGSVPALVKRVKSRGKEYTYFVSGRNDNGVATLVPLPPIGSENFAQEYDRLLNERRANDAEDVLLKRAQKTKATLARIAARGSVQYVYFIVAIGGEIKIGTASSPKSRLQILQVANPARLELVAVTPGGEDLEKGYHRKFAQHRLIGEWFASHPDIWNEIVRVREAGTNRQEENAGKLSPETRTKPPVED